MSQESDKNQADAEQPPRSPEDAAPELEQLREEAARLRQERDRLEAQLKRAMADLQNVRKRHLREMEEARQLALEGFAAELLPVLDNFHLALDAHERHESGAARTEAHALVEGLEMVRSLLQGALERHGLAEIPALGETFDPNVHEAVGVDTQADIEPGKVSRVMQRGYSLKDKIIRPSKVLVAGEPAATEEPRDRGSSDAQHVDDEESSTED